MFNEHLAMMCYLWQRAAFVHCKLWSYRTLTVEFGSTQENDIRGKGKSATAGAWYSFDETQSWMGFLVYLSLWSNGTAFALTGEKNAVSLNNNAMQEKKKTLIVALCINIYKAVWTSMSVDIACQAFINTLACRGLGLELFCLHCTHER